MSKIRQQIAAKQAELRILKLEEATINKLSASVKDQINRLKIEAMAFNSAIVDRNVRNATQPTISSDQESSCSQPSNDRLHPSTSGMVATMQTEQAQQGDLEDLDLMVPPSGGIKCDLSYNEESSDDEDDANECLLQL